MQSGDAFLAELAIGAVANLFSDGNARLRGNDVLT